MEEALAPLLAKSRQHESAALARLTAAQWGELSRRDWSREACVAVPSHRLRLLDCALRVGDARAWRASFEEIAVRQRSDGAFPAEEKGCASDRHATATAGELLLRASLALPEGRLAAVAQRALEFVGSRSPEAASVDEHGAVLHFVGVARALLSDGQRSAGRGSLVDETRGAALGAILAAQRANGSIAGDLSTRDALGTTSRALIALAGEVEGGDLVAAEASGRGLAFLAERQAQTGAFGDGDAIAPSVWCTRAAMLAARTLERRVPRELDRLDARRDLRFVERGFAWLLAARSQDGWGERPGDAATFERSCDGLALLAEVAAFRGPEAIALARLWGIAA